MLVNLSQAKERAVTLQSSELQNICRLWYAFVLEDSSAWRLSANISFKYLRGSINMLTDKKLDAPDDEH